MHLSNTVNSGNQYGPVLLDRDFTGLTFGVSSPAPSGPGDLDAG